MTKNKLLFLFFILSAASYTISQTDYKKKFVTVIPGKEYEAGWLHNIFFGKHWRDLWTTPVKVEVLDLNKFAEGLVPFKTGGGYQTKTLHFWGSDGQRWKFRSINKDPTKILPPELQETIVADILKDQISSSNPLAPLVVVPILEAVGVLQAKPKLVLLPDDEKLGEFRKEYGGVLGMIEIHPDESEDEAEQGFENSEKVKGTFKLLETLEEKRDNKIDDKEFLKARLVDIFLGDWDRHSLQWRWARFDEGDKKIWQPVPKDRDQVFSKYDGFFPSIASYFVPQLTNFGYSYPQVEDITWNGRFLDRRFLTEIDKKNWDSVTSFVHNKLTDELIHKAVNQLPPEFLANAGEELISKLKSRRDKIFDFSNEYYEFVNEVVDIFCSNKNDYVEVNRLSDNETEVAVYKFDEESGEKKGDALYYKIFDNNLTNEFRINLLEGDDKVVVNGRVNRSPLVRIIGGPGKDELVDNSIVDGYFLSVIPIPDAENKTIMYDKGNKTKIKFSTGTCWDDEEYAEPENELEKYEPELRDRGQDWIYKPVVNYNSDDGFLLGSGFILNSYNFRANPLEYKMNFSAAYATNPGSYIISYNGDFYSFFKGALFNLDFYLSELSLINYYGFGNETDYDKRLDANDYYRLNQEIISIHPSIKFFPHKSFTADLGISYNYSETSLNNDTLLSNFTSSNYGLNSFKLFGIHSSVEYDSRDIPENPYKGINLQLSGSYFPEISENRSSFLKAGFDVRAYMTTSFITDVTLALRSGGERLFGTYPFFKAAFLGGSNDLRGYNRERFSGDASLFGQAELRFYLTDLKLILNGRFGFFTFAETGRVFVRHGPDEVSKKWHPSYGAGLWISYLNRLANLNFTVANSEETVVFYFTTSFMF